MREPASDLEGTEFHIEEDSPYPGTVVLIVRGEADLHVAPDLRDRIAVAIAGDAKQLVVDLTEATFIDSTILGVLLGAVKRLRSRGGQLRVVVARTDVRRLFEITLLDRVFPIHDRCEDALVAGGGVRGGKAA